MLRSTDHHYAEIINFFQEFDNNTIVVLTGDHGKHEEIDLIKQGQRINDVFQLDPQHQFRSYGSDVYFDVSSIVADLSGGKLM